MHNQYDSRDINSVAQFWWWKLQLQSMKSTEHVGNKSDNGWWLVTGTGAIQPFSILTQHYSSRIYFVIAIKTLQQHKIKVCFETNKQNPKKTRKKKKKKKKAQRPGWMRSCLPEDAEKTKGWKRSHHEVYPFSNATNLQALSKPEKDGRAYYGATTHLSIVKLAAQYTGTLRTETLCGL